MIVLDFILRIANKVCRTGFDGGPILPHFDFKSRKPKLIALGTACFTLTTLLSFGQARTCVSTSANAQHAPNFNQRSHFNDVYLIPVVIHIIYAKEEQNISASQIHSQLDALNKDFRRRNDDTVSTLAEFKQVAADSKIEFFLARHVNQDTVEPGVVRVSTDHGPFANSDVHYSSLGGSDASAANVLNVWVADLAPGLFGYSKRAPGYPPAEEGIVIDYEFFGTMGTVSPPYNKGRTLVHEIGHWLGLSHPWGDAGCSDGDGIHDTPDQETPSFDCDLLKQSCGSTDMVQNYMDLSQDDCINLFTQGQAEVMRSNLESLKIGIPKAAFLLKSPSAHAGNDVTIFPNPASNMFSIECIDGLHVQVLRIVDSSGKSIQFDEFREDERLYIVPAEGLRGLFILQVNINSQKLNRRVILN